MRASRVRRKRLIGRALAVAGQHLHLLLKALDIDAGGKLGDCQNDGLHLAKNNRRHVAVDACRIRLAALFGLSLLSLKFLTWPGFSSYLYSDVGFLGGCVAIALLVRHRFERASWSLATLAARRNWSISSKALAIAGLESSIWVAKRRVSAA